METSRDRSILTHLYPMSKANFITYVKMSKYFKKYSVTSVEFDKRL